MLLALAGRSGLLAEFPPPDEVDDPAEPPVPGALLAPGVAASLYLAACAVFAAPRVPAPDAKKISP